MGSNGIGSSSGIPILSPITGTAMMNEPIVYPSAGCPAASTAPGNGPPPPPGLFTTAAATPYSFWKSSAIIRVRTSSRSPGGQGTMKLTGFSGYSASAGVTNPAVAAKAATIAADRIFFIESSKIGNGSLFAPLSQIIVANGTPICQVFC